MRSSRTAMRQTVFLAVVCAGMLTGCATRNGYNLTIELNPSYAKQLHDDKVFVHVIPVNQHDQQQAETDSIDKYWRSGTDGGYPISTTAPADEKRLVMSNSIREWSIKEDDPIWVTWKNEGAVVLEIISSRPIPTKEYAEPGKSPESQLEGQRDPRRRFISTDPSQWASADVRVEITDRGLKVETAENGSPK